MVVLCDLHNHNVCAEKKVLVVAAIAFSTSLMV